jgi:hypothetical protein
MRVEVENAIEGLANGSEQVRNFDKDVTFRGSKASKARALARFSKDRKHHSPGSTDRLRRVQDVKRHPKASTVDEESSGSAQPAEETEVLFALDTISSLVYVETQFWLSIGEVTGIKVNGQSAAYVNLDMLGDDTVTVSYQLLGLRSATNDDDPDHKHDWRMHPIKEHSFTVPGRLIQPVNPTVSKTTGLPFYLLESAVLVALTASLFQSLAVSDLKRVPSFCRRTNIHTVKLQAWHALYVKAIEILVNLGHLIVRVVHRACLSISHKVNGCSNTLARMFFWILALIGQRRCADFVFVQRRSASSS